MRVRSRCLMISRAAEELVDGHMFLQPAKIDPFQLAVTKTRQEDRRLPQGLRGESPRVGGCTSQDRFLLDQGHTFAEVSRLRSAFLTGGAGANHHQIVFMFINHTTPYLCQRGRGTVFLWDFMLRAGVPPFRRQFRLKPGLQRTPQF